MFASHEWLANGLAANSQGNYRRFTSFELEGSQVEQLENQLRAKDGVAKKPGSGGEGPTGSLAGAVGGEEGAQHAGDGRAGAGEKAQDDLLNNALGGSMAGSLALGAMKSMGGGLLQPKSGAAAGGSGTAAKASEEGTTQAELGAQLTGEGEDVPTVADVAQQEEMDQQEAEEGEGPPEGDIAEKMGKAPDVNVADLYKYYANRLARRARQAAILADNAVQEAWKQQQLARFWSRQALEDEAATMRLLPAPKGSAERDTWQLHVPPGWELPPSPLVSTRDPRTVTIYSGAISETLAGLAFLAPSHRPARAAPFLCPVRCHPSH